MEVHYLLDSCCSTSLICLDNILPGSTFQEITVVSVAFWIQVISDTQSFFHRSHPEVALLAEFRSVLMDFLHEALVTAVEMWVVILHVLSIDFGYLVQVIKPSLEHGFGRCGGSMIGIRFGVFGSVRNTRSRRLYLHGARLLGTVCALRRTDQDVDHVLLLLAHPVHLGDLAIIGLFVLPLFVNVLDLFLQSLCLTRNR